MAERGKKNSPMARGLKKGMQKAKFGRKGKAVVVGPGRRFEDGSARSRAGVSAQPAARKARTAAVNNKAQAKNKALAADRAKTKSPVSRVAAGATSSTRSKVGNVPLRARNPGGGEFGAKPKRTAKPQSSAAMKARASGRATPYAGSRAKALAGKKPPSQPRFQNQRAAAPKGQSLDLLGALGDAVRSFGAGFGKNQIRGALDNPATRAGGVNKYLKNK